MNELDLESKQDIRKILVMLYGAQANNWSINDRLANIVLEMAYKSGECSDVFAMVPQPYNPFSNNPLKALGMQYAKKIFKSLSSNKYSVTCMIGISYGYATKVKEAAQGL